MCADYMTRYRRPFNSSGFALIEIIIFIVVSSVLVVGLFAAFANNLRNTPQAGQIDRAADIAQQRMELILAQRRVVGFAPFVPPAPSPDPCVPGPGPAACTPPAGFNVSSSIVAGWNGDLTNYAVVTVSVTGQFSATATALVANY